MRNREAGSSSTRRLRRTVLGSTVAVALAAMAFGAPSALASGPDLEVSDVSVNSTSLLYVSAFVTFTNVGDANADIATVAFDETNLWFSGRDNDFCSGAVLAPEESCVVHVSGPIGSAAGYADFDLNGDPDESVYVDIG